MCWIIHALHFCSVLTDYHFTRKNFTPLTRFFLFFFLHFAFCLNYEWSTHTVRINCRLSDFFIYILNLDKTRRKDLFFNLWFIYSFSGGSTLLLLQDSQQSLHSWHMQLFFYWEVTLYQVLFHSKWKFLLIFAFPHSKPMWCNFL